MLRNPCRLAVLCGAVLVTASGEVRAQVAVGPSCGPTAAPRPHVPRGLGPRSWWAPTPGPFGAINTGRGPSYVPGGIGPGFVPGLPRGRRYYGGRYFGSFNNRYYSPQYGYF